MSSCREIFDGLSPEAGTNTGLWLDRGLQEPDRKGSWKQNHFAKLDSIKIPNEYEMFFDRWKAALQGLSPYTILAKAMVIGRMAVGLGAESILETSITLHRTYGVPYIPGSALKGLAAATAHQGLEDESWRKARDGVKIGESQRVMFGDTESSGYVTFHDALWIPTGKRLPLDLDVMTVHHPQYYQATNNPPPPTDWDNPNPVTFLSARGTYLLAITGPEDWTRAALGILKEALARDGVGAKTAAGYGRMSVTELTAPARE